MNLIIVRENVAAPAAAVDTEIVPFETFRGWIRSGALLSRVRRYGTATHLCYANDLVARPALTALALRLVARESAVFTSSEGATLEITWARVACTILACVRDFFARLKVLFRLRKALAGVKGAPVTAPWKKNGRPIYLRTDLVFGLRAGGSVAHTAGVLNNLSVERAPAVFIAPDPMPGVNSSIESHYVRPSKRFWDFNEFPTMAYNETILSAADRIAAGARVAFIYHRYSKNSIAGLQLARKHGVPFVLEYNGSELWVSRNWGGVLPYESLTLDIEETNLRCATLVVVVSKPLADELIKRGVAPERILVNPNGVDPDLYSPSKDGSAVRRRLGLEGKTVVGFIGTFGPWHGAEVLAEAAVDLFVRNPSLRDSVRFLFVGDGDRRLHAEAVLARAGLAGSACFTGRVPQANGAEYLAACDILASPHVPNADGTPFFGSPTKLFEYMAMGKGIVASRLEQIGEILAHDVSAWLVPPADSSALADGLKRLVEDRVLRDRLGRSAREVILSNFTWKKHTDRILEKLRTL